MTYVRSTQEMFFAFEYGGNTPSAGVERKFREEVLPHYFEPSTRQLWLETAEPTEMLADNEMTLDSPPFTPEGLKRFAAQSFHRRKRG